MINNGEGRIILDENYVFTFTSANMQAHQEASLSGKARLPCLKDVKHILPPTKEKVNLQVIKCTIVQFSGHSDSAAIALFGLA